MNGCFVGVMNLGKGNSYVYVGCPDRAEFDKITAEAKDHGLNQFGDHVVTKTVEQGSVVVIFQHWISREPVDSFVARKRREHGAAQLIVDNARCSRCGAKLDGSEECGQADCPHISAPSSKTRREAQ